MASRLKRFSIEINAIDTLVFSVEISAAQFDKTLSELRRQHDKSKDAEEDTFRTDYRERKLDTEKYSLHEHRFEIGSSTDISLIKRECKPGYYFSK